MYRYDGGRLQMEHTYIHSYAFYRFVFEVICTSVLAYLISIITRRDYINMFIYLNQYVMIDIFQYFIQSSCARSFYSVIPHETFPCRPIDNNISYTFVRFSTVYTYIYIYTNHILRTCYFYCCICGVTLI